jgi:superfamily II RNA helicase
MAQELLLTEMVFDNVLAPLGPAEIAALLSTLVCQEKNKVEYPR